MREAFQIFSAKNIDLIWDINFWNFNKTLSNDVISCEQPGPDMSKVYPDVMNNWALICQKFILMS